MVLVSIIDIRDRKRAEQHLRLIMESAPSAMILVNSAGLITLVNSRAESLFGYPRADLMGQPVEILVPTRFRTEEEGLGEALLGNHTRRAMGVARDLFGLRRDGSEVQIEIGLNPMQTGDGIIMLALITDVTERRRTDRALRHREERFRLMTSSVQNCAVYMLDSDGYVESWDQNAELLKGYSAQEIIGEHFSRFYPPEMVAGHFPERELSMAVKNGNYVDEGWRVRKDGSHFWAKVIITAIYDANGKIDGFSHATYPRENTPSEEG